MPRHRSEETTTEALRAILRTLPDVGTVDRLRSLRRALLLVEQKARQMAEEVTSEMEQLGVPLDDQDEL